MFHLTLPLPISKNKRVQTGRKKILAIDLLGKASYSSKVIVRNSKAWGDYKNTVCLYFLEAHYHMDRIWLKEGERLVFDLTWFLKNERTDCINFHDLLADAIEKAMGINDKNYLFRDQWVTIDPKNPRVELTIRVQTGA